MNKYHKKCWSCDEPSMEPVEDYYKCTKCGATWNETPRPGFPELEVVDRTSSRPVSGGIGSIFSPSKSAQRRAAKARDKAQSA